MDLVIEVLDSRVPLSTRHPRAESIFGNNPRLMIMTKEDLADPDSMKDFRARVEETTGYPCLALSLKRSGGRSDVIDAAIEATRAKQESLARKGLLPRPMRVCVAGMPNVGKSSLINWLIGRKKARTGNRPGVTVGTQWVRVHPKLELLDTPGILPPTTFTPEVETRLAIFNLLPEGRYDVVEMATRALVLLRERYPEYLESYIEGLRDAENGLEYIASSRNLITSGASPDILRAAGMLLADLRDGKVGRISLDS